MPSNTFPRALALVVVASATINTASGAQPAGGGPAGDQPVLTLSLADAVRIAELESEALRAARAGVERALGHYLQARAQRLPEVSGSATYQRAIQSQFAEVTKRLGTGDGSGAANGNGNGGGADFADSPLARIFASPNTFVLGLSAAQTIYSSGRVRAGVGAAEAGRRAADLGLRATRAQVVYQVAGAYFDAQVATQLAAIADSSYTQADRAFRHIQLARELGNAAEYDLIRARVQRDNASPALISARAQRDLALTRLRQMLNLPADRPLVLSTAVEEASNTVPAVFRTAANPAAGVLDTAVESRALVRQAAEQVRVEENQLAVARAERRPALALSTSYQRFAYPTEGSVFEESWKYYFPNWTVSLGISVPVFTGGRQQGRELVAQANLAEARARYDEAREAASLDTRLTLARLEEMEAVYAASIGTDTQAARAYAIAEVRFAEGVGTQLELTQARVDLETARANRVRAARDLALARLGAALLADLPFGVVAGGARE